MRSGEVKVEKLVIGYSRLDFELNLGLYETIKSSSERWKFCRAWKILDLLKEILHI